MKTLNIYLTLLKHNWLKNTRSSNTSRNIIVNIFIGISVIYFLALFVIIGFVLPGILSERFPEDSVANIFNGALVYISFIFLFFRYTMQPLSNLNLDYYQSLPIKRSTIINFLLFKPLANPVNYLALCFAIPFSIGGIYPTYGGAGAIRFLFISLFIIWSNILIAPLLKRRFNNMLIGSAILLCIGGLFILMEQLSIFSLFKASKLFFGFLISHKYIWIGMVLISLFAFFINKRYFSFHYYSESSDKNNKASEQSNLKLTFMDKFGSIGNIIALEIKLILRHKRTKNSLFLILLFVLYGIYFYSNDRFVIGSGMLFIAIFITGAGMIQFGQWIISWDGSYFDLFMTRGISTRTYIHANYYLLLMLCMISFVLSIPLALFGKEVVYLHLVAIVYNLGVNIYFYLFMAIYSNKRFDLSDNNPINMQGFSYKNFLVFIPLFIIPVLIFFILKLFSATNLTMPIIAFIGLIGILFRNRILLLVEKQFSRRKYNLCNDFRNK